MKKGVVSVIVCCYNGAGFLPSCFDSLLAQTYNQLEVIFIDDGSTDGSYILAKGYESSFADEGMDLICLKQDNQGAGFACANGLLSANGEFISCFDVDDYLYPDSILDRVLFLNDHTNFALVRTNGYKISEGCKDKVLFVTDDSEKDKEDIFEDLLLGRTNNWAGSYMVRSSVLWSIYPDHRIPGSRYGQNLQILMPVAWKNKAGFIDEPLMEYRFNPASFTNQENNFEASFDRYTGYWQIRKDILSSMGINDTGLYDKLAVYYGKLLMDLCIQNDKRSSFLEVYDRTAETESPGAPYGYYYCLYKGQRLKALLVRLAGDKTLGEIIRFGIVGVAATLVHYGIYLTLKHWINLSIAYIIGYGLSFIANYFLSASFTFKKKTSMKNGLGFLGAHLFNMLLQTGLLNLFVHLGVNSSWAPVPVYAIAIPVNFLLVRRVFNHL